MMGMPTAAIMVVVVTTTSTLPMYMMTKIVLRQFTEDRAVLRVPQIGVDAVGVGEQLGVSPHLGDLPLVHHQDLVAVDHRRQSVGNYY